MSEIFDVKKEIMSFQFSEKIKSELIIAAKLLQTINGLKADELTGAKKLMSTFLDALLVEITIAQNVVKLSNFEEAKMKVMQVKERIYLNEYLNATKCLSEAISLITTSAQRAIKILIEKNLF